MSQEPTHKSLDEINQSVEVPSVYETSFLQKFLAYSGPGALVAVGYMDPGNWLTSLSGGSQFRYALLSVLLMSILVAMFMSDYCQLKLGSGCPFGPCSRQLPKRCPSRVRIYAVDY